MNVNPTECVLHDNGPLWEMQLLQLMTTNAKLKNMVVELQEQLSALSNAGKFDSQEFSVLQAQHEIRREELKVNEAKVRKVTKDCLRYRRYLEQYETSRAVIKQLEQTIVVGEAIVYRDFVAQYACQGNKVNNLILVVLWRATDNGVLEVFKLNHFCSNPAERAHDSYYVADVFDFYFNIEREGSSFFKMRGIKKIYLSGDHSPHFASKMTMFNESCMYHKYGLIIHCIFLCSYHAFNRCDGAGVEPKVLNRHSVKERREFEDAEDFANALNKSNHANSMGYVFTCINRDISLFELVQKSKSKKNVDDLLREMCEVKYDFMLDGEVTRIPGIILCRHVAALPVEKGGVAQPYIVMDL